MHGVVGAMESFHMTLLGERCPSHQETNLKADEREDPHRLMFGLMPI